MLVLDTNDDEAVLPESHTQPTACKRTIPTLSLTLPHPRHVRTEIGFPPVPADPHSPLPLVRFPGAILSDNHKSPTYRDDYSSERNDLSCLGSESWVAKGRATLPPIQYRDAWVDYYAIHGGAWQC